MLNKNAFQMIMFLMTGALTAVIYFSIFTIFWKWMNLDYKLAVTIAYFLSVAFQFTVNRFFTFKSMQENMIYQLIKFIVLLIINYLLTLIIVVNLVKNLSCSPYLAILLSVAVTVVTGFLFSRFWIFKTHENLI